MYSEGWEEGAKMFVVLRPFARVDRHLTVVYSRPGLFEYNKVVMLITVLTV